MQFDQAESLRLVAGDVADIEVVSTLLQDAIIAGSDMHYDAHHNCFMIVANRFCWERPALADVNDSNGEAVHERALCGYVSIMSPGYNGGVGQKIGVMPFSTFSS